MINAFTALVVPFALVLPVVGAGLSSGVQEGDVSALGPEAVHWASGPGSHATAPFDSPFGPAIPQSQDQVRIEQRVVIRIAPRGQAPVRTPLATMPDRSPSGHIEERKIGNCLPIGEIAGVQPTQDNRLLLYMEDRRLISATLDRTCSARDFYSGFYVEKNSDGKLCVRRDMLKSRSGASCEMSGIRELVAVRD